MGNDDNCPLFEPCWEELPITCSLKYPDWNTGCSRADVGVWNDKSGLKENESVSHSVTSDALRPCGLWPASFLCPWNYPDKNTWSGLPFPSWGDLPDPGITWVSCTAGRFVTIWATRKAQARRKITLIINWSDLRQTVCISLSCKCWPGGWATVCRGNTLINTRVWTKLCLPTLGYHSSIGNINKICKFL